jgi:tetratricopeptide (TPR) repeat protein
MVGRVSGRQTWLVAFAWVAAVTLASHAAAQGGNAMLEGVVKDPKGAVVTGAVVNVRPADGSARAYNTKTDKNGKFIIIGIYPTEYNISATHEANNLESPPARMRLPAGRMSNVELILADRAAIAAAAAAATPAGKAEAEARAKMGKVFDEGVAAANSGNHDVAIQKFNEAIGVMPACGVCYKNLGFAYTQKKEYDQAEAAYKKAIEIQPDADAYNGLANVYNAQKKFELAAEASSKAAQATPAGAGGGGNADALYAQGVNLYNANKPGEAKAAFQSAVKANPSLSEAHYMLGLVLVGEGDTKGALAAFETYLKLDPNGKNASTAKAALATLK